MAASGAIAATLVPQRRAAPTLGDIPVRPIAIGRFAIRRMPGDIILPRAIRQVGPAASPMPPAACPAACQR
jgi:hypothetical protein